jgi:hypothetical protein
MHVICAIFQQTINNVQRHCFEAATKINDELEKHFLSLGCDGCFKAGLLILNLHVNRPFLFIRLFSKVFIISARSLDHPKLGPWLLTRCEHFESIVFFFKDHNDVQCSMGYGPAHGCQFNVQTLE